jgi:ankyrin repeat protein
MTELIEAIKKGDIDTAIKLIEKGKDIDTQDEYGWNALMYARLYARKEIITLLEKHAANK